MELEKYGKVELTIAEYTELIADCERMNVLRDYMSGTEYKSDDTIRTILGMRGEGDA